jgi:hypothetical protein
LFPHVHVVFIDGVWFEAGGGRAEFREAGAPDEEMVFEAARRGVHAAGAISEA